MRRGKGFGIGCILAYFKGFERRRKDLFSGDGPHRQNFKGVERQMDDFWASTRR